MRKDVRQADIAEALGISIVSVSKALAGKSGVGPDLRKKILEKAEEIGYTVPSAAGKKNNGNLTLALIFHEKYVEDTVSFYAKLSHQISVYAMNSGNYIISEVISRETEQNFQLPRLASDDRTDGVIILGNFDARYLRFLAENLRRPFVLLDNYGEMLQVDSIISDGYYGAYTMTNHLLAMGHRKIAYVGTLLQTGSITDRYFGYERALLEHGLRVREDYVLDDRGTAGVIYPADLLTLPQDMPTAFFCNSDTAAAVLIRKLQSEGYRVPEDISVAGFDNFLSPGACDIGITSYEVDMDRMAKCAVNLLSKKIRGVYYRKGLYIMEGHLVIKDSVRRLT
ncbi:MAG: LacI family DNA-binding transcriptional regulator [Lachnospiraceae bacterium]|nr:LacI family DNA-binding transcriptional regulator [Lachnospiraceae bacterium]